MKRESYIVTLVRPKGVTKKEMRQYIEDAVSCWKGGSDPDGALYELDGMSVKVRSMPGKKRIPKAKPYPLSNLEKQLCRIILTSSAQAYADAGAYFKGKRKARKS